MTGFVEDDVKAVGFHLGVHDFHDVLHDIAAHAHELLLKLFLAGLAELADFTVEVAHFVDFLVAGADGGLLLVGGQLGLLGVGLEFVDLFHVGLERLEATVEVGLGLGTGVIQAGFGVFGFVVAGEEFIHVHNADLHLGQSRGGGEGAEDRSDGQGDDQLFHRCCGILDCWSAK